MHAATPLISTIAGGLVLAFLLGILANRLRISPLLVTLPQVSLSVLLPLVLSLIPHWHQSWLSLASFCLCLALACTSR